MLSFDAVTKRYDGVPVVDTVSFDVPAGAFAAIIGESGSGKSTALKMINRLVEPSSGTVRLNGADVGERDPVALRRSIGYAFQGVGLFPHMTAAENVAVTPRLLGWEDDRIARRTVELMENVGLAPDQFADRLPHQLSGGQRQRVGFARALAAEPELLLLDEPFGALDPVIRNELQDDLKRLHNALGLTTVMVTHDMAEALLLADMIVVLHGGRVLQVGAPSELLNTPADDYVAALIETPRRQAAALETLAVTP